MAVDAAGLAEFFFVADGALHHFVMVQVFERSFADQALFFHGSTFFCFCLLYHAAALSASMSDGNRFRDAR